MVAGERVVDTVTLPFSLPVVVVILTGNIMSIGPPICASAVL